MESLNLPQNSTWIALFSQLKGQKGNFGYRNGAVWKL